MKIASVAATALACSTMSSAWSWPSFTQESEGLSVIAHDSLHARQNDNSNISDDNSDNSDDNGSSAQSTTATINESESSDSPSATPSSADNGPSTGDSSSSGGSTATKAASTQTSPASINPQAPVGGMSMITPAATGPTPYYKVGQTITMVWNYTSLLRQPKHIDILATAAAAGNYAVPSPFTLAVNETFDPTQTFTWDTGKYYSETNPLPIAKYTLIVYDADASGGVSQTPSAGYLGVCQQFRFGMYTPQAAVALANPYVCATCNSAASLERMTIGAILATAGMTVASFMWFTGGWRLGN